MTDDEIAERIAKHVQAVTHQYEDAGSCHEDVVNFMSDAEVYHLAFVADVRERAQVRRQAKRVRAKVFEALGVADRKAVAK